MDLSFPNLQDIHTVADCKHAIRKVREMKEALIRNTQENCKDQIVNDMDDTAKTMDGVVFFESIPFVDFALLPDIDETTWLKDAPSVRHISVEELENDKSFQDSSLLNIQYSLLNCVKSAIFEQKIGEVIRDSKPRVESDKSLAREWRKRVELSPSSSSGSTPESNSNSPRDPDTASSVLSYRLERNALSQLTNTSPGYVTTCGPCRSPGLETYRKKSSESSPALSKTRGSDTYRVPSPGSFKSPGSEREQVYASSPASCGISDLDFNTTFVNERSPLPLPLRNDHFIATPPNDIDTRTYTRPKKIRNALDSSHMKITCGTDTLTINRGTPKHTSILNQNGSLNLNETFIHEDATQKADLNSTICIEKSNRRVSRNASYVVRRNSDSPSCDSSNEITRSTGEMNTTFIRSGDDAVSSPTDSNSSLHNISMEELHNMARLQEQSLKTSASSRTMVRHNTHVIMEFPIISPQPRPPVRTSSTDTYSVTYSNQDSPTSSGLSSPIDTQSYGDISSGAGLGRSMPNLAMPLKTRQSAVPEKSVAAPMNKYQSQYTSDSKLSRPNGGSKLSLLKAHASGPIAKPNDHSNKEIKIGNSHFSTNGNLPHITSAKSAGHLGDGDTGQMSLRIAQPTKSGLPQPRFTSSQIRPPSVRSASSNSMLPAPGFSSRLQSRIPAPGAGRGRPGRPPANPTSVGPQRSTSARPQDWREGCY